MEEQKNGFIEWIKAHKKELLIAGISITAIIAAVLVYRNRESIVVLWDTLKKTLQKTSVSELPVATTASKVDLVIPTSVNTVEVVIEPTEKIVRSLLQSPFEVTDHIRNLPEGWRASADKIATAAEHGYELLPGQTWVERYMKNEIAA
jgi:hypothetical protein